MRAFSPFLLLILLAACDRDRQPDLVTAGTPTPPAVASPADTTPPAADASVTTPRKSAAKPTAASRKVAAAKSGVKSTTAPRSRYPCSGLRGTALDNCVDAEARKSVATSDPRDDRALREFQEEQRRRDRELIEQDDVDQDLVGDERGAPIYDEDETEADYARRREEQWERDRDAARDGDAADGDPEEAFDEGDLPPEDDPGYDEPPLDEGPRDYEEPPYDGYDR